MNKKEDIKKKLHPVGYPVAYCTGIDDGVDETFKEFGERAEFYQKYKFKEEYHFLKYLKFIKHEQSDLYELWNEGKFSFNDTLFTYCFGDVMKGIKNEKNE